METPNRKTSKITNYKEALAAVRHDGLALEYVPLNLRTAKMCLEALKSGYWIRKQFWIYEKFKTAKLYFEAVKNRIGTSLRSNKK